MEKNKRIELADQVQMYTWTIGVVIIVSIMLWDVIDGGGRSFARDGATALFFVTNLNIVLNRVTFRDAMRKSCSDTPTTPQPG